LSYYFKLILKQYVVIDRTLAQICYKVLEQSKDAKQKHTRQTIFEVLLLTFAYKIANLIVLIVIFFVTNRF